MRVIVLFANAGLQIPAALFIVFVNLIVYRPAGILHGALVAGAALAGIGALLALQRRWWLTVLRIVALIGNVAVILIECYSWYDEVLRPSTQPGGHDGIPAFMALTVVPLVTMLLLPFVRRHWSWPRCWRCGYDLSGAAHLRCPECGALVRHK